MDSVLSITGAIGKPNALANYIIQLQWEEESSAGSSRKKRKLNGRSDPNGQVQFPISLSSVDQSTVIELINILDHCDEQKLDVHWDYSNLDIISATMRVVSECSGECILENDCCIMSDQFSIKTTKSLVNDAQLFVAIAFGAHFSWLSVSNVKLCPSTDKLGLILKCDITVDIKKAELCKVENVANAILRRISIKNVAVKTKQPQSDTTETYNHSTSSLTTPLTITPSSSTALPSISTSDQATINNELTTPKTPVDTSLASFYENLQPLVSEQYLENYTSPGMTARLNPFQTQNVEWMVNREGHVANENGNIIPNQHLGSSLPLLFTGSHSSGLYKNLFTNATITDRSEIKRLVERSFKGGILADEMGLGKTVSVLGLISKHIYNKFDPSHPKISYYPEKIFSKGTLVVAPGSIMSQWASEAKKHAPHLSVYEYNGTKKDPISAQELAKYDIVLVYYETFSSELRHSKPPPDRPRRQAVKYKFKLSPLISIFWFRCILDEAQMVDSTTTQVASMANQITRWYSWGVTGTPMKNDYNDLYGLYTFLQLEDTVSKHLSVFKKFHSNHEYKGLFFEFTKATIRRNMKSKLSSQVSIPKQSRHVVRIPFSTIEQHYYDDFWRKCRQNLRLDWMDSIGWEMPLNASESVQTNFNDSRLKMRSYLLALRQNCIHPSVISNHEFKSGYNPNNTIASSNNRIRTLDDVLHDMAKNAKDTYDNNQHAYFSTKLRHGGMFELLKDWTNAVSMYVENIPEVEALVNLHEHEIKSMLTLDEKITATSKNHSIKEEADVDDERKIKITNKATVLNKWKILLNRYYFYLAGVYHALNYEDLEILYYDKSAGIRRTLLEKELTRVESARQELDKAGTSVLPNDSYNVGPYIIEVDLLKFKEYADEASDNEEEFEEGDKRERHGDLNMIENLKNIGIILDKQYQKILFLRNKTIEILNKGLIDNSDDQEEATGDEYENSLNEQEMCQVYISAYQALLQDRKYIIKGTIAPITDMIGLSDNGAFVSNNAKQVEQVEINFRKQLRSPGFHIEALKDIEYFLKTLKITMRQHEFEPEYSALMSIMESLKTTYSIQSKLIDDLDVDFRKLNQLYNSRISYYKHLQQISDTLIDWEDSNPQATIRRLKIEEEKMEQLIIKNKSRDMYFKALVEEHENINRVGDEARKECLICREPIEKGLVTYCGHTSCIDCGHQWFNRSRRCHTCNSTVNPNEWYNVSYKKMEMHDRDASDNLIQNNSGSINYTDEDRSQNQLKLLIERINTQNIKKGQGAKLDSIIRHIKYIKTSSNGKCVVFSQWTRVLDMLKIGLKNNDIKYISLSGGSNKANVTKFQEDPSINVILLHARSQSSGLTLVSAQTVFIVEPVLNESLEKQAINRIHRIGQTKQTSVFWYLIRDSIEERIYEIHNRKREKKLLANTANIDDKLALSKLSDGGGEYVGDDDLRRCFTANEDFLG